MNTRQRAYIGLSLLAALLAIGVWSGINKYRSQEIEWTEQTVFSMGTLVSVKLPADQSTSAEAAITQMDKLAQKLTRFQNDGEVARTNEQAGKWVAVSADTLKVVEQAIQAASITNGAFDPTIAPLVDLWGLGDVVSPAYKEPVAPPDRAAVMATVKKIDYRRVQIDRPGSRVKIGDNQQIDLGGIAKGYIADAMAAQLRASGVRRALVNIGGNLVALGSPRGDSPWRIGIQHPRNNNEVIAVVDVKESGISTSGDYQRFFESGGKRYSHLLNPHSGWPAEGLTSVTIIAPTAAEADYLSTAAFILGADKGLALLERLPGVEGVFVDNALTVKYTSGLQGKVTLGADISGGR